MKLSNLITFISAIFFCLVAIIASESGLKIDNISKPDDCSVLAKNGDTVHVHYSGKLESNGKVFDSSYKRNTPLPFKLGSGRVIKGWEQGILGMCVGEERTLTIPHELAYGERGFPPIIPPKSTLIFDVKLMKIDSGSSKDEF
ncbi:hypothetical protein BB559_002587 [Furculomyces boomerangus]|uniref:peptidylprolyl isomerase n=1 Tax=Furculomyces boomerangus TaxID=61424 RepID=A0A2T9YU05_9FUNG|nr:hypothetical protein BB559_002587 [Furculomyces boomerangus]